jgi:hypothetical protein
VNGVTAAVCCLIGMVALLILVALYGLALAAPSLPGSDRCGDLTFAARQVVCVDRQGHLLPSTAYVP